MGKGGASEGRGSDKKICGSRGGRGATQYEKSYELKEDDRLGRVSREVSTKGRREKSEERKKRRKSRDMEGRWGEKKEGWE